MPTDTSEIAKGVDLERQYGQQLTQYFPQYERYLRNPDDVGLRQYERMLTTDETVGAGFELIALTVITMLGEYHHPTSSRITTRINDWIAGMEGSFNRSVYEILSALPFGYSATEAVYKADGAWIVPERLVTYNPRTIVFKPNVQGQLLDDSIRQYETFPAAPEGRILPRDKMLVMTHNKRYGNHYGQSILRRPYKNWLIKDHVLKGWARGLDRFGTPLLVGLQHDRTVTDPADATKTINATELMLRVLAGAADSTALVVPLSESKDLPQPDVKAVTEPNAGMGEGYHQLVLYLNKGIFRGILIPSLLVEEGQHSGSYALAGTHFELFEWMTLGVRDELVETLIEQFVRKMIDFNFGPQKDYGTFQDNEVRLGQKEIIKSIVTEITDRGYMSPEVAEDYRWARRTLGLPELGAGAVGKLPPNLLPPPPPPAQVSENPAVPVA